MVPPARWRAQGARKGERAVVRARCGPTSLTCRASRAHSPCPAARSAAPQQLPSSRRGRWGGRGRGGARVGGAEGGGDAPPPRVPLAPSPPGLSAGSASREEGAREGVGGGVATAPSGSGLGSLPPHTLRTSSRGSAAGAAPAPPPSRPLAERRSCQPLTEAGHPAQARCPAAGSDGSGSCHVERERGGDCGGCGMMTGSRVPGLGSRAGRFTADLWGPGFEQGHVPGTGSLAGHAAASVFSPRVGMSLWRLKSAANFTPRKGTSCCSSKPAFQTSPETLLPVH
ncbi:elastin-like [Manis pentadactyla]|uniref:elastin-like n=1 Tax=Manis pentadactyla TaxID=143292 RepID=UPI00255CF236|nr:elastin-like [Manis pentadactyla]